MNLRAVVWLLGCVLLLLAGLLLVPAGVAVFYGEWDDVRALVASAGIAALLGAGAALRNRGSTVTDEGRADYFRREGLAVVGLVWFFSGAIGALPFLLSGAIESPVDAFFESVSDSQRPARRFSAAPRSMGCRRAWRFGARSRTGWAGLESSWCSWCCSPRAGAACSDPRCPGLRARRYSSACATPPSDLCACT